MFDPQTPQVYLNFQGELVVIDGHIQNMIDALKKLNQELKFLKENADDENLLTFIENSPKVFRDEAFCREFFKTVRALMSCNNQSTDNFKKNIFNESRKKLIDLKGIVLRNLNSKLNLDRLFCPIIPNVNDIEKFEKERELILAAMKKKMKRLKNTEKVLSLAMQNKKYLLMKRCSRSIKRLETWVENYENRLNRIEQTLFELNLQKDYGQNLNSDNEEQGNNFFDDQKSNVEMENQNVDQSIELETGKEKTKEELERIKFTKKLIERNLFDDTESELSEFELLSISDDDESSRK